MSERMPKIEYEGYNPILGLDDMEVAGPMLHRDPCSLFTAVAKRTYEKNRCSRT